MMMLECQKFRKKPVVIDAIRYSGDNLAEVLAFTGKHPRFDEWFSSFDEYAAHVASDRLVFKILTLEGTMEASPGDWIIKGVNGEFYPCKPDIFAATYEPTLSTITPAEVGGLVERLRDESMRLSGRSLDHGCVDSGIAANVADEAVSLIQSQAARIAELEAGLDEAKETLYWASRRMKGNCAGADVSAVTLSAHRARALLNKEASHD